MAEPARASALEGAPPADGAGVRLTERQGLALVHLAGTPARQDLLDAVQRALDVALPLEPDTTTLGQELTVFWLAPGRWLVESSDLAAVEIEDRLRAAADAGVAITDLSSGRTVIRIAGEAARRTLAKGCPIDLHPRALPPGRIAHSMLEGIGVMLHHLPGGDGFDLYVARSYALAAWTWLTEAACCDRPPGR